VKDINGNEVKRPLTAYMLFNNYRRPILRSEHPGKFQILIKPFLDLSLPDLSKLIGQEWAQLNESQKKVRVSVLIISALKNWNDKAREQKLEYNIKVYNNDKRQSGDNENAEPEKKEQSK